MERIPKYTTDIHGENSFSERAIDGKLDRGKKGKERKKRQVGAAPGHKRQGAKEERRHSGRSFHGPAFAPAGVT